MTEPSFNVPVLVEWLKHLPVRQTVSGSRDLRGTSQFIHNLLAFNIENLDTRLSLGPLNEKFKQVYVAVQSAFKRSRTVEDIQREMSLRCENGAKLLTRRHHALRRVTPRGVKSQYSSSNVGMQHEKSSGPLGSPRRSGELNTPLPKLQLMRRCRALRRVTPRGFKTQHLHSKRYWPASGSPGCSRSENGDEALTRRCCALRRVAPRDLEKKTFSLTTSSSGSLGCQRGENGAEILGMTWAGNGGAVLPRRVRHAASYRCYRRIPPRDAAVSPRPKVRTRRSYHALRRVPPRTAASPPHHRRVQVFFFGINLEPSTTASAAFNVNFTPAVAVSTKLELSFLPGVTSQLTVEAALVEEISLPFNILIDSSGSGSCSASQVSYSVSLDSQLYVQVTGQPKYVLGTTPEIDLTSGCYDFIGFRRDLEFDVVPRIEASADLTSRISSPANPGTTIIWTGEPYELSATANGTVTVTPTANSTTVWRSDGNLTFATSDGLGFHTPASTATKGFGPLLLADDLPSGTDQIVLGTPTGRHYLAAVDGSSGAFYYLAFCNYADNTSLFFLIADIDTGLDALVQDQAGETPAVANCGTAVLTQQFGPPRRPQ
ncbi:hypothetical protein C8F04DRAFT_1238183 [Mycena alexandri]|uniref:Uncharacterized protein n=1 Tax=Mycena alexandri TaxID=1745969 RepID=A0AAD6SFX0_9AGAR|nr:hypothetical protein C8F04DRAFT_1238183 [Mycena alexandri]